MATITIGKQQWPGYLAALGASLDGKQALIEVAGLPLGDQIEARWIALLGISYDRKDDAIVLDCGDLSHVIRQPVGMEATTAGGSVVSIAMVDREGIRHIARFRDPLMLTKTSG
jgi:Family of unknown function (DUF5335)